MFWYYCYDLTYKYLVMAVSLLFATMMYSSWELYLVSDAIGVAQVSYDMFD